MVRSAVLIGSVAPDVAFYLLTLSSFFCFHNVMGWPLNWNFRFYSPISYWDNAHFGRQVGIFEWILDLSLVGYLIFHWRRSKVVNSEV